MDDEASTRPGRRTVLAGLAAAGVSAALSPVASAAPRQRDPDLGPNVLISDPATPRAETQARLDAIFRQQERAHFTDARHVVLFKPGCHQLDLNVGSSLRLPVWAPCPATS